MMMKWMLLLALALSPLACGGPDDPADGSDTRASVEIRAPARTRAPITDPGFAAETRPEPGDSEG